MVDLANVAEATTLPQRTLSDTHAFSRAPSGAIDVLVPCHIRSAVVVELPAVRSYRGMAEVGNNK